MLEALVEYQAEAISHGKQASAFAVTAVVGAFAAIVAFIACACAEVVYTLVIGCAWILVVAWFARHAGDRLCVSFLIGVCRY